MKLVFDRIDAETLILNAAEKSLQDGVPIREICITAAHRYAMLNTADAIGTYAPLPQDTYYIPSGKKEQAVDLLKKDLCKEICVEIEEQMEKSNNF